MDTKAELVMYRAYLWMCAWPKSWTGKSESSRDDWTTAVETFVRGLPKDRGNAWIRSERVLIMLALRQIILVDLKAGKQSIVLLDGRLNGFDAEFDRLHKDFQNRITLFWYITTFECFLHRFFSWRSCATDWRRFEEYFPKAQRFPNSFGQRKTNEYDTANSGIFFSKKLTANFSRWAAGWKSRFRKREKRWGRQLKYRIHSAASCQISHSDLTFLRSAD